ncbi:hypothetical protein CR513_15278, partial [Mucuna pruriens]
MNSFVFTARSGGLRKVRSTVVSTNSSPNSSSNSDYIVSTANNIDFSSYSSSNCNTYCNLDLTDSNKPELMGNQDCTLKELSTSDVLEPTQSYELKSGLIHLLPKFHGLAGEGPHKHLKEFHVVCSTMRLQGILENYIKIKTFPFSLDRAAKDWLYLQPALFNTWGEIKRTFLEKFLPTSRTVTILKGICGIQQHAGETLHAYWERFNTLCAMCPHHQINEQLLIQYFYEGLMMMDRSMIDAASGGALMDKTPAATRGAIMNKIVNEVGTIDNLRLENQLIELTLLVRQLAVSQHQQIPLVKICGICTSAEHPTDMCPTLQETKSDNAKIIGAIGGNQYGRQPYQTRLQSYRLSPSQGQYAFPRFRSAPSMSTTNHNYYQQPRPRYSTPLFQQQ